VLLVSESDDTSTGTGSNTHITTIKMYADDSVWIDNQKVKGHLCCPDTIKGGRQIGNEITKIQQNGDESNAATCGVKLVKNKLWVIIGRKGRSLASLAGHDQVLLDQIVENMTTR
jgi:hypothetical protein